MKLLRELLEVKALTEGKVKLTAADKQRILDDLEAWSGGMDITEMDDEQLENYAFNTLSSEYDSDVVYQWLTHYARNKDADYIATDIHHNPDGVSVHVIAGDDHLQPASSAYHGISVVFLKGGKIELVTADKVSDWQAENHRAKIIAAAKDALDAPSLKHLGVKSAEELKESVEGALLEMPMPSKAKASELVKVAKEGDVDKFAHAFSMATSSAIEMWLDYPLQRKLMRLVARGAQVTSIGDTADAKTAPMQKKKLEAAGWKLFAEENNFGTYEAIYYKLPSAVKEAKVETIDLNNFEGKEIPHQAWPKGVMYRGHNVFDVVYKNRPAELEKAEEQLKRPTQDYRRIDFQEVYLGYDPDFDNFIQGYDGWVTEILDDDDEEEVDTNASPYIIFKIDDSGKVRVVKKGLFMGDYEGMWYNVGGRGRGGYAAAHKKNPNLIDIRLD